MNAAQLIKDNACTAQCLLAQCDADKCACQCGGELHGILADALISSEVAA